MSRRLKPPARGRIVRDLLAKLAKEWTCRHGAWNRDHLFTDLERALKARRKDKSHAASHKEK